MIRTVVPVLAALCLVTTLVGCGGTTTKVGPTTTVTRTSTVVVLTSKTVAPTSTPAAELAQAACDEMVGGDVDTSPISLAPQYVKQIADARTEEDLPSQDEMDSLVSTMREAARRAPADLASAIRQLVRPVAQLDAQLSSGDFNAQTGGMITAATKIASLCNHYGYHR